MSLCRSAIKTKWPMGPGDHPFNDEEDTLDQPEICRRNQVCRVDAGWKIACTRFHGIARRQKTGRSGSRSATSLIACGVVSRTIRRNGAPECARIFGGVIEHKGPGKLVARSE